MEQDLRRKAVSRSLQGEAPVPIYTDLKRSENWFFKWLKRYQSGDPNWFKDKSKAPLIRPTQVSEVEKQPIVSVRNRLDSERFAQIGASAIKWELSKSKYSFPSDRTINRVLKREGLIKKKLHTYPKGCTPHITYFFTVRNRHVTDSNFTYMTK
jgi:transposase-like protein